MSEHDTKESDESATLPEPAPQAAGAMSPEGPSKQQSDSEPLACTPESIDSQSSAEAGADLKPAEAIGQSGAAPPGAAGGHTNQGDGPEGQGHGNPAKRDVRVPEKIDLLAVKPGETGASQVTQPNIIHEKKPPYLQKAGVNLFYCVLALAAVVILALFIYLIYFTPKWAPPATGAAAIPVDTIGVKLLLAEQTAIYTNFIGVAEKLLIAFLLPVLTGILGYVFGSREKGSENS